MSKQVATAPTFTVRKVEMFVVTMAFVNDEGEPIEMETNPFYSEEDANKAIASYQEQLSYEPLIRRIETPEGL